MQIDIKYTELAFSQYVSRKLRYGWNSEQPVALSGCGRGVENIDMNHPALLMLWNVNLMAHRNRAVDGESRGNSTTEPWSSGLITQDQPCTTKTTFRFL